jgi:hypothetical protein
MPDYSFHYDPPKVRISDSEIVVQKTMLRTIAICLPGSIAFAVPNAAKRSRWAAAHAKREGLLKGAPDLVVMGPSNMSLGEFAPLSAFIEVKAKSSLTPEQLAFHEAAIKMGHYCGVFRSDQTLIDKLKEWGFR